MSKVNEIREALKLAGYNQRMVSVVNRPGGVDWMYILTIRNENVIVSKVHEVTSPFISVDRCSVTNEVLHGGNSRVSIEISESVKEQWSLKYLSRLEEVIPTMVKENTYYDVDETFSISRFNETHLRIYNKAEHKSVACRFISTTNLKNVALQMFYASQDSEFSPVLL